MGNWVNIEIAKHLEGQINSRAVITNLMKKLDSAASVVLDFKEIDFISRSAAHQLLTEIDYLQQKGISVTFKNPCEVVESMLLEVDKSRKLNFKRATYVKRRSFSTEKELDQYLLAI